MAKTPNTSKSNERLRLEWVPITKIVPNPQNVNVMKAAEFERLKKEIAENGVIDAPSVVEKEDGTYMLLGGYHRWQAMRELGWEECPVQIVPSLKKWSDKDLAILVGVRLNVIHGSLDPVEFAKLHAEMAAKYGAEAVADLLGFTDQKVMMKVLGGIKKNLKKVLPPEMHGQVDQAMKEAKTVEDLGIIINELFAKYGETVSLSFMFFKYGSQDHVYIQMDKVTRKAVDKIREYCIQTGTDINAVLGPGLQKIAAELGDPTKLTAKKADGEVLF